MYTKNVFLYYVLGFSLTVIVSSTFILWRPLYFYILTTLSLLLIACEIIIISPVINLTTFHILIFYGISLIFLNGLAVNFRYLTAKKEFFNQKELEYSKQELLKINSFKNRFYENVTNEFIDPLANISASCKYCIDYNCNKNLNFEVTQTFDNINRTALILTSKLKKYIEISKINTSQLPLNIKKINLQSFITNLYNIYKSNLQYEDIEFTLSLPNEDIENFYSDQEKLEQIINNLLSNSIKFRANQKLKLSIEVEDRIDNIEISIKDNGIGLSKEDISNLFIRYKKLNTYDKYAGYGIGLSHSKELITLLNGYIFVHSDGKNLGSTFTIYLPKGYKHLNINESEINKDEDDIAKIYEKEYIELLLNKEFTKNSKEKIRVLIPSKKNNHFEYKKSIILLADDDPYIIEILKNFLLKYGFENFILISDKSYLISSIYDYHPDIIICDFKEYKNKITELQKVILNSPNLSSVTIVLLSSILNNNSEEKFNNENIIFLNKPIEEKKFIDTISFTLKHYMTLKKAINKSNIDFLTGNLNKNTAINEFNRILSKRTFENISVIFFDVDNFKTINDTYGHLIGDEILKIVGHSLNIVTRKYDIACRYGGDEFLVILQDCNVNDSILFIDKFKNEVNNIKSLSIFNDITLTFSFGISSLFHNKDEIERKFEINDLREFFIPSKDSKIDWNKNNILREKIANYLIKISDDALYESKTSFCNNCGFSSKINFDFINGCKICGSKEYKKGRDKITISSQL
ncbi:diguanylate cyclase [Helicovermis profundi]